MNKGGVSIDNATAPEIFAKLEEGYQYVADHINSEMINPDLVYFGDLFPVKVSPEVVILRKTIPRFADAICDIKLEFADPIDELDVSIVLGDPSIRTIPTVLKKLSSRFYEIKGIDKDSQFVFSNSEWRNLYINIRNLKNTTPLPELWVNKNKSVKMFATWVFYANSLKEKIMKSQYIDPALASNIQGRWLGIDEKQLLFNPDLFI